MDKIFEIYKSCSSMQKITKEGISKSRMTQMQSIVFNNLNNLTTIEQLYVGLEMVLISLDKVLGYVEEEKQDVI